MSGNNSDEFDFVLVGGGLAGLVVASRLSEDPNTSVMVLEAGVDQSADPRIRTPALWTSLLGNSDFVFPYSTTPQEGLDGKQIYIPQGRQLGGSSAVNGLAYVANSKKAVDAWGEFGNTGWNWDALEPYFLKSHRLTKPSQAAAVHLQTGWINDSTHGGPSAPVETTFAEETQSPLPAAWIATISQLGYPPTADPFTGSMTGVYANPMTIDSANRTRTDSVTSYYMHAKNRANLKATLGATVGKIIFETGIIGVGQPKAKGVQVKLSDGTSKVITVKKEVILAAGAVGSPKLLELSGVGGKDLLNKLGIQLVYDNRNVGENLQDHVNTGFSYEVKDGIETLDPIARGEPEALAAAQEAYATNKSGPFSMGGNYIGSLLPLPDFTEGPEAKKTLEKVFEATANDPSPNPSPFVLYHAKFVHNILGDKHESSVNSFGYAAYGDFIARPDGNAGTNASLGHNFFTMVVAPAYPLSLGSTHISSSNPEQSSTIDPRYLTHPLDQEVMARHLRYLGKIAASPPLNGLFKEGGERNYGAPEDMNDLESLKAYARKAALTNYHLTSSCAMLPEDRGGVVDPELQVYGVRNVRVVDSSVIPLSTKGNPQSTVFAVAEKAADIIKKAHGLA